MDITHNLRMKTTVEKVYTAVSTQKGINAWWSKEGQVSESIGGDSLLKFDKQGTQVEMGFKTLVLDLNKKVVWECMANPNPAWLGTQIITEIEESENGVKVRFSHAGFDEKWKGQEAFEMTKATWNHFMESLKSYVEGGEGQPW